jgi:hypothetical protein
MLRDEGGVCTVSSSVRRARSNRGTFAPATCAAFGTDVCFSGAFRARRAGGVRFLAVATGRRGGRFLTDRFADRLADGRLAARRAGLARFAAFFAFELFRFAIASILSEP